MNKHYKYPPPDVGTCYALNIGVSTQLIVVIAASDKKGRAFGYFFEAPSESYCSQAYLQNLKYGDAILRQKFGDLGICNGEWLFVGFVPSFQEHDWPVPPSVHKDIQAGIAFIRYYDRGTLTFIREEKTTLDDPRLKLLPEDSGWGHKVIEKVLKGQARRNGKRL